MKIIGISSAIVLSLAMFACQNPTGETTEGSGGLTDPTGEERLEEPQVRDGVPEAAMRDSLTTDTANLDTFQEDITEEDTLQ